MKYINDTTKYTLTNISMAPEIQCVINNSTELASFSFISRFP